MASGTQQVDATFLEKVGDKLSSFSEGFVGFLSRVLGSSNEKRREDSLLRPYPPRSLRMAPARAIRSLYHIAPLMRKR